MQWQEIVYTVIALLVTSVVMYGITQLKNYIATKLKDGNLKNFLNIALSSIQTAVKSTYQTYVESIKGTKDWTTDAQQTALNAALETAKASLSSDVQEYIKTTYGDVDTRIITQIEATLHDLKNASTT